MQPERPTFHIGMPWKRAWNRAVKHAPIGGAMTDIYRVTPAALRNPRLVELKGFLVETVAQEMQNHSLLEQQSRQAVQQWLSDALDHSHVELSSEVRRQLLNSTLA